MSGVESGGASDEVAPSPASDGVMFSPAAASSDMKGGSGPVQTRPCAFVKVTEIVL